MQIFLAELGGIIWRRSAQPFKTYKSGKKEKKKTKLEIWEVNCEVEILMIS